MIVLEDVEQGTKEWHEARSAIPTASEFSRIMTPSTLKPSASAVIYRYELVAQALGANDQGHTSYWMERGTELEDEARAFYEFKTGNDVQTVGFVYQDESKSVGCSPDGLIGKNGGLELKAPKASTQVKYLLGKPQVPNEYKSQVFGSLLITQRKWWDFCSYHPRLEPFTVRTKATSEEYLAWSEAFTPVLEKFLQKLQQDKDKILKRNHDN